VRFLLVDRIEDVVAGVSARGWKTVAMSEDYLEWHFPDRPILPGTLVAEAFAQLAGWHEAVTSDFSKWLLVDRVVSARYFGFSGPGDRVVLALEVLPAPDPERRAFRGEATVDGQRRALVEFEGVTTPLETLESREHMQRVYLALRGEKPARDARGARP
jgi:3-hydroxyacyl-[acyl-carrier-protein] dehydratase